MRKNIKDKPVFNDVLDVLNPNFTATEKITGMATLPLQPVLHPFKAIKGVFETYGKLASIPLAAYSGNLQEIPGIISGTSNFSGKDVVSQLTDGASEDHKFIQGIAGFGLDIAADPFIGFIRLPEKTMKAANELIVHSAMPGVPTAIQHFGISNWIGRFSGTGVGRESEDILINAAGDATLSAEEKATQVTNEMASRVNRADAEAQISELNPQPNKYPIHVPDVENRDLLYIENPTAYLEGQRLINAEYDELNRFTSDAQIQADTAELIDIAEKQHQHKEFNSDMKLQL